MKDTLILAIESSCDETCSFRSKKRQDPFYQNVISSQIALHTYMERCAGNRVTQAY